MSRHRKKAVCLLSGGIDSATTMAIARSQRFECYALTFRYGQRHATEVNSAKKIARSLNAVEHRILDIDLAGFGGSALTDHTIEVPKNRDISAESADIPITYVPARNLIFLSLALSWAEVIGSFDIFIGVNAIDYSGYPDCRGEFISAFEKTANLAVAAAAGPDAPYTIHTPVIEMTKAQVILAGTELGVDFSLTHSCYDPDENSRPCGKCDSCRLRLKGFKEANLTDPVEYAK